MEATMTDDETTELVATAKAILRQAGYVPFLWHIDDVRCLIEDREIGLTLTDAECLEVLDNAHDNHNAEIGMNWDVIEAELGPLLERQAEEGGQP